MEARPLPQDVEIILALVMMSTRPLPHRVEKVLVVQLQIRPWGLSDMSHILEHQHAQSQECQTAVKALPHHGRSLEEAVAL